MAARFVNFNRISDALPSEYKADAIGMISGKTFPPDDVKALWHMVPGEYTVEFVPATSMFLIRNIGVPVEVSPWGNPTPDGTALIHAKVCFEFEVWVKAFQDLYNKGEATTLSRQNIDKSR